MANEAEKYSRFRGGCQELWSPKRRLPDLRRSLAAIQISPFVGSRRRASKFGKNLLMTQSTNSWPICRPIRKPEPQLQNGFPKYNRQWRGDVTVYSKRENRKLIFSIPEYTHAYSYNNSKFFASEKLLLLGGGETCIRLFRTLSEENVCKIFRVWNRPDGFTVSHRWSI